MVLAASRVDAPAFWKEVAATPHGGAIATCIQCGTCTSSCPVEAHVPDFNVRRLVARVKLGLRDDVLSDPAIWTCTRCFACVARCPKHVEPGEIVEALRHLALREGRDGVGPRHARAFADSVRENGRIHESRVTIESIGVAGVVREGLLPVRMALHGKMPSLRRRPLKTVAEVQALIAAAEESP